MIFNKNPGSKILYLVANVSGDIIHYGDGGYSICISRFEITKINDIINKDLFLKISMCERFAGFISTRVNGYSKGLIATYGKGISKRFEIILFEDKDFYRYDHIYRSLEKALLNGSSDERKKINLLSCINDAQDSLLNIYKNGRISIDTDITDTDTAIMEPYIGKIILMCIMYMISAVSSEDVVRVCASDTEYGKKITLSIRGGYMRIRGIYDFCEEYPTTSAISAFARVLCNHKGVELIIDCINGKTEISAVFPRAEIKEFSVYNSFKKGI